MHAIPGIDCWRCLIFIVGGVSVQQMCVRPRSISYECAAVVSTPLLRLQQQHRSSCNCKYDKASARIYYAITTLAAAAAVQRIRN